MRDTIIYMRGPFPPLPPGVTPERLLRDAKVILRLAPSSLDSLRHDLDTYPGFVDRATIEQIFRQRVPDGDLAGILANFITQVNDYLRVTQQDVNDLVRQFESWLADETNQQQQVVTEEEFRELKRRLTLLIRPVPGLSRQLKAERVSAALGQPLERIELICDLRPVFDDDHEVVEGMIPLTTLRVVCKGADGLPTSLETVLSEKDVDSLAKAASDAKKKLEKLRRFLDQVHVPMPSVELTRRSERGVGDEDK